jgi:hypothetical protein
MAGTTAFDGGGGVAKVSGESKAPAWVEGGECKASNDLKKMMRRRGDHQEAATAAVIWPILVCSVVDFDGGADKKRWHNGEGAPVAFFERNSCAKGRHERP